MSIKIMIIEDDLIIGENLKENLEELGYDPVGIATNYRESVQLFELAEPDLCMVDIYLKGSAKNGIDTIYELKQKRDLPIIFLTSFDDTEFREKAKKTNPSAYLIKPASKKQIDVAIDFALTNYQRSKLDLAEIDNETHSCPLFSNNGYFFLKVKDRYEKIYAKEIVYMKAAGPYSNLYTSIKEYIIPINLKQLLISVQNVNMFRCHRSWAINIDYIHSFDDSRLFLERDSEIIEVPISNDNRKELMNALPKLKTE